MWQNSPSRIEQNGKIHYVVVCRTSQQIVWDQAILDKYNYSGPRYTSYPTAVEFHEAFTIADFDMACTQYPERPLSLYIHIPFCHKLCYYCGCNKVITRHSHKADEYLDVLEHEIRQRASLLIGRNVTQLHFGGGTPTFLTNAQISRLMTLLRSEFHFADEAEISIEIDPREIQLEVLDHLRQEGFNRVSIGCRISIKKCRSWLTVSKMSSSFLIWLSALNSWVFVRPTLTSFTAYLSKPQQPLPRRCNKY